MEKVKTIPIRFYKERNLDMAALRVLETLRNKSQQQFIIEAICYYEQKLKEGNQKNTEKEREEVKKIVQENQKMVLDLLNDIKNDIKNIQTVEVVQKPSNNDIIEQAPANEQISNDVLDFLNGL